MSSEPYDKQVDSMAWKDKSSFPSCTWEGENSSK